MTTMKVTLAEMVKATCTNLTVLKTIESQMVEEDIRRANEIRREIYKLIKQRSNLLGLSGMERKIQSLTRQINNLRTL